MDILTPEQLRAIKLQGDVLVVASAGTGKTTTLISRCENYIFDRENPVTLDRILMVTFTEAAAAEMKLRLRKKLEDALTRSGSDSIVARQYALLPTAHICTLHSFCLRLVKMYFHELELDPQVDVLDEGQAKLIALRVLENIFNNHYAGETEFDKRVQNLIAVRARGYDEIIKNKVLQLHYFSASLPFSELWLKQQRELFNNPRPQVWIQLLDSEIELWAHQWLIRMMPLRYVENVAKCIENLNEIAASRCFLKAVPMLIECRNAMEEPWARGTKTKVRDKYLKNFIKELDFLCSFASSSAGENTPLQHDWDITRDQILTLIDLVKEFNEEFRRCKLEMNALDFNDLEQMTLKLLFDSNGNETEIAGELRQQFELIFVDEYQDINPAQHLIISAISRRGGNRFLVGDVKQSIYQFRHANPYIFLKLASEWQNCGDSKNVVQLTYNFRSHPRILSFVNDVFSVLMKQDVADIEYNESTFLRPGINQGNENIDRQNDEFPRVELNIILNDGNEVNDEIGGNEQDDFLSEEPTIIQKEAALIADKIRKLKNSGFRIFDKKLSEKRPIEWHDIAVLLRSPVGKSEIYAREFAIQGIPLIVPCGDALSTIETQDLINMLRLLDNPFQDLPLAAVLYSPLVGFSILELCLLRQVYPRGRLWNAVKYFPQNKNDLEIKIKESLILTNDQKNHLLKAVKTASDKVTHFLQMYERWRNLCRQMSLSQTLETILDDTQYIAWCQGQADGARKHANVQVLLELTRQFDPLQRQGLFRFLRYIDSREEGQIETEPISSEGTNAVRLISIHQSKGLEFPIVFVSDLGKQYNFMDINSDIILDFELGICPKVYSQLPGQSYPSPAHWIARKHKLRKMISEEIRLLYVAFTRARDLLILTGVSTSKSIKNLENKLLNGTLASDAILTSRRMLDLITLWLWQYYKNDKWLEEKHGKAGELYWTINRLDYFNVLSFIDESILRHSTSKNKEYYKPEVMVKLDEKLKWTYPEIPATLQPAKTSVSDIRRQFMRELDEEASNWFKFKKACIFSELPAMPGQISAPERGELYHKFLELVDLSKATTIEGLIGEVNRLVTGGRLPENTINEIDLEKVVQFFNSDIGFLLLSNLPKIRRELTFTVKISDADLNILPYFKNIKTLNNDFIVLQGVVDLAMIGEKEIWVLDYKTDNLSENQLDERICEYLPQLELYGFAMRKIYHLPVTRKWLHFILLNKTVEC